MRPVDFGPEALQQGGPGSSMGPLYGRLNRPGEPGLAANSSTSASRIIWASPERVYRAFVEPAELLAWLPPGEMTGQFHEFDARVGGGYVVSLYYPERETLNR